jgi:hypothetical protein
MNVMKGQSNSKKDGAQPTVMNVMKRMEVLMMKFFFKKLWRCSMYAEAEMSNSVKGEQCPL